MHSSDKSSARIRHWLYGALYAATIIAMNPFVYPLKQAGLKITNLPSATWTQPKVLFVLIAAIVNALLVLRQKKKERGKIFNTSLILFCGLWCAFLVLMTLSTILGPFPAKSLLPVNPLDSDFFYWFILAAFAVSNAAVLKIKPSLFRYQAAGILAGASINALSIFPQLVNWTIDYTWTSGQIAHGEMLKSFIWKEKTPIGLFSNRGHAGFVIAAGVALSTCLWLFKKNVTYLITAGITFAALLYGDVRAASGAFICAALYIVFSARQNRVLNRQSLIKPVLLFAIIFAIYRVSLLSPPVHSAATRDFNYVTDFTGRPYVWRLALKAIGRRPIAGYGFSGYRTAFPFAADMHGHDSDCFIDKVPVKKIVVSSQAFYQYVGTDNKRHAGRYRHRTAHNLILDQLLLGGIIGLCIYGTLLIFGFVSTMKSPFGGIESVGLVYLLFTIFWFECPQYSHIGWWALSCGAGYSALFPFLRDKKG